MRHTITTTLRLVDRTVPITIRQAAGSQWIVVMIDDKPPRICKRGHAVIGTNTAPAGKYMRCRYCQRYNLKMSRQRKHTQGAKC
jgi:hypothetical protein